MEKSEQLLLLTLMQKLRSLNRISEFHLLPPLCDYGQEAFKVGIVYLLSWFKGFSHHERIIGQLIEGDLPKVILLKNSLDNKIDNNILINQKNYCHFIDRNSPVIRDTKTPVLYCLMDPELSNDVQGDMISSQNVDGANIVEIINTALMAVRYIMENDKPFQIIFSYNECPIYNLKNSLVKNNVLKYEEVDSILADVEKLIFFDFDKEATYCEEDYCFNVADF